MTSSAYLEERSSQAPALELLTALGYQPLSSEESLSLRGGKTSRMILEDVLATQLRRINRINFRGQEHAFSDGNIQKAVQALTQLPFDSLIKTSEDIYDLITLGKSLEQTIDGYTRSYSLHYIDWEHPENNVFHVCSEFEVERHHSKLTRRPDLVLFVNGIPLVVIECKRPDLKDAAKEAVSQHLRNQRHDEIPELYAFSQLLLALSQNRALFATTDTPEKFWSFWKEESPAAQDAELATLIAPRLPSEQDRLIHSLLRKERLLELVYRYIVYDAKVKKVCRYQQYFAIQSTLDRVTQSRGDEARQGGVIWHTTGSGKSLTMVMLAKALTLSPAIRNPRVILVTDRVDLDDQIYKTFKNCGKQVAQARTGEDLVDLIVNGKAPIITTIINKFGTVGGKRGVKDPSPDIFVLVDESHRSQYGEMSARMRNVFPNACYIGFTGTPLLKIEKETARKFGGFIHSYTMSQAIKDGAVTPLLYEGRYSELHGDREQIDRWFERITKDLTNEQKADLKKKFRREEELTKADQRIAEIAYDVIQHYTAKYKGTGLKGQLACTSKEMALRYKAYFEELGGVSVAVVISAPDTREGHTNTDESSIPAVQKFWKDMMDRHGNEKDYVKNVTSGFNYSDEPEILIVVDKLLTGFDAPRNAVLYIDKRLKDHNILQAIARVNRLFDGKDFGLIIDYRGIFGELNDAIDTYAELENQGFDRADVEDTLTDVSAELAKLPERHTHVWDVFKPVAHKRDIEAMQRHLEPADIRQRFYEVLSAFARTLQLAIGNARWQDETKEDIKRRYRDDLREFLNLRAAVKQRYGESVDYSAYEAQIRNLVNKYIGADTVRQIVAPVDIYAIDAFEQELLAIEGDAAKADAIANRVKKTITENMDEDPALYKRLSEMIDETIAEHRARRLSDAEYLARVRKQLDELRGKSSSDLPASLKPYSDAKAYYGVIREPLASYDIHGIEPSDLAAEIAIQVQVIIDGHKIRDWQGNDEVRKAILNAFDDYFDDLKETYGLDVPYAIRDELGDQLLRVAKRRDNA